MKYSKIREEIKRLSQEQVDYKPQRKTVNFSGNRTIPVWKANQLVMFNAYTLMHLFLAYAKIKGKDIEQPKHKIVNEDLVQTFVTRYTERVEEEKVA